jgi:hypothetical protein
VKLVVGIKLVHMVDVVVADVTCFDRVAEKLLDEFGYSIVKCLQVRIHIYLRQLTCESRRYIIGLLGAWWLSLLLWLKHLPERVTKLEVVLL